MMDISKLTDNELVLNVQTLACSDSFNEISRRHSNLFYKVCQTYIKPLASLGCHPSDIFDDKDIVMFEAVTKFKNNKGTLFSTWLGNYTRYFCLNKINHAKKAPEVGEEEEIETVFAEKAVQDYEESHQEIDVSSVFKILERAPDKRIPAIFKLRYDPLLRKKRTWLNIANQLKFTVQTTIQLHKRGLSFLREELASKKIDIFHDILLTKA